MAQQINLTYTKFFEEKGFKVEVGMADMPTAFVASWGEGTPIVGFLGEFDALPLLSQEAACPVKTPIVEGAYGHGCGHNCLGVGSLAAVIAVKEYLEANKKDGTIIYFGCPAEEGAGSKQFMEILYPVCCSLSLGLQNLLDG